MIIFYYLQLFISYVLRDFIGPKMNPLGELVKTFTFILRGLNNTAQFVIANIFQQEQRSDSPTKLAKCKVQFIFSTGGAQFSQK